MSAGPPNSTKQPQFLVRFGVPLALGVFIEIGSELLKSGSRHMSKAIPFAWNQHIYTELTASDLWLALLVVIAFIVVLTWALEKYADKRWWIRSAAFVFGVMLLGVFFDPLGSVPTEDVLTNSKAACLNEKMDEFLSKFQYARPRIELHTGNPKISVAQQLKADLRLDCIDDCWIRLTYDIDRTFADDSTQFEFDKDLKLIRHDGKQPPACPQ